MYTYLPQRNLAVFQWETQIVLIILWSFYSEWFSLRVVNSVNSRSCPYISTDHGLFCFQHLSLLIPKQSHLSTSKNCHWNKAGSGEGSNFGLWLLFRRKSRCINKEWQKPWVCLKCMVMRAKLSQLLSNFDATPSFFNYKLNSQLSKSLITIQSRLETLVGRQLNLWPLKPRLDSLLLYKT